MIRFYKYIFANLYKWANKSKYDQSPEYTAFFSLTFLVYCNLMTSFALIRIIYGRSIELPELNKLWFAIIGLVPAIPQWFYLIYRQQHKQIIKTLANFKLKDSLFTWFYILLSIGLMFLAISILIIQNNKYV